MPTTIPTVPTTVPTTEEERKEATTGNHGYSQRNDLGVFLVMNTIEIIPIYRVYSVNTTEY